MKRGRTVLQHETTAPTLFDLIAREWQLAVPAAELLFTRDGSAVAFAGADGSITIAATDDPDPPEARIRMSIETGRTTIRPRQRPAAAPISIAALADGPVPLAADRGTGFVAGAGDGRLCRVTTRGEVISVGTRLGGPISAVDHSGTGGRIACATGGEVAFISDDPSAEPEHLETSGPVAALAFSPDGTQLVAAHPPGLALWRLGDGARRGEDVGFAGGATGIAWAPGGDWLACPLAAGGFRLVSLGDGTGTTIGGYPAAVRDVVFSGPADVVATSGAFRAVAWPMPDLPHRCTPTGALETGRPRFVVVDRIAAHPRRSLLAIGHADGLVTIAAIGRRDELLVREAYGAAVTALRWSPDGHHLAISWIDGSAAIATFPSAMFK